VKKLNSAAKIDHKTNMDLQESTIKKSVHFNFLIKYILLPIRSGILGFATIFIVLIATKYFSFLLHREDTFSIDLNDVMLSSIGFFCLFLIYILKNSKQD
jgi:hypothetical protein